MPYIKLTNFYFVPISKSDSVATMSRTNKKRKELGTSPEDEAHFDDLEKELEETKKKLVESDQRREDAEERAKTAEERAQKLEDRVTEAEEELQVLKAKERPPQNDEDGNLSDDENSVIDENDTWTMRFKELREHRIVNGNCKVPKTTNQKLHKWVQNQRQSYAAVKEGKKGQKLPMERIIKLESIGFVWGNKYPAPPTWDEQFEELKKFQKAMGHCNIMVNPTSPSPLAKWVSAQRYEYKRLHKGKDSLLSLDQITQLREINFKWKGTKLG